MSAQIPTKKLTSSVLANIRSLARGYIVNDAVNGLEPDEFITACYAKAVVAALGLFVELELPKREFPEPEED
jgi:hypothetical protein